MTTDKDDVVDENMEPSPPMTILTGWREQYERMQRSHKQLKAMAQGETAASSDQARDGLIHFYQDAYHLKDWIKNDPSTSTINVEGFINDEEVLRICADLCNGTKHLGLDPTRNARTGDHSTGFATQSVNIHLGRGVAEHGWTVESEGQTYDAVQLADTVVATWRTWLAMQGVLGE